MTLDTFKRTLDNIGPQLKVIALWNQGEPTINNQLPEMVQYAHERKIYTMTSTNGMLMLRRNLIDRLIEAGLDEIIFSIDGLTPESYQIYRIGGKLEPVVEGMRTLRRRRNEMGSKTPRIVMQWLPMKHNQHEIPYLRAKAKEWGADSVEIKTTQVYTQQQYDDYLPDIEALRRYERKGKEWQTKRTYQSCKRLWFSTMIDWNGNVAPCCFDKDEEFLMGNVVTEEFREIWHNKKYNSLRGQLLIKGRGAAMCRNCTEGLRSYYIPLNKLERFAEAEIPPVPEENKPKRGDYSDLFEMPVK
jgi:radical SAM protein with 4Fe4S-binding SPASM domain